MPTPEYDIKSEAQWISIRESRPNNHQPVLVYGESFHSNGPAIIVATYRENSNDLYKNNFWVSDKHLYDVTHWLPLPEAPV